jgi:hypothetical protein
MEKESVAQIQNEIPFGCKKNEILSFVTTWMELEMIILREISKPQEDSIA